MGRPARLLPANDSPATASRLRVAAWQDVANDPALMAKWAHLAREAVEPNPFYAPWALLPALRAYDTAGRCVLLLIEHGNRLTGLMPVSTPLAYYGYPVPHYRNWVHDHAFLGTPLVAPDTAHDFWADVLGWMDGTAGSKLFLHLSHLDADGALARALGDVLQSATREHDVVHEEKRALLHSDQSSTVYFDAALSGKKRKELRRQERRLGEAGKLDFNRDTDDEGLDTWITDFLALERSGWKGRAGSALADAEATETLFSETLHGAAQAGVLERLALALDGQPIAMLANFLTPPGAFAYKTAYSEDFARYSPGVLLQRHNLALLDRADIDWCDSCAVADHPMIDHIWRERRRMVRMSIAIGGTTRRALFSRLLAHETRERATA